MITHDARRSLPRGNNPVPSPWLATMQRAPEALQQAGEPLLTAQPGLSLVLSPVTFPGLPGPGLPCRAVLPRLLSLHRPAAPGAASCPRKRCH